MRRRRYLLAIAAAALFLLIPVSVRRADVSGSSMEPALSDGDILLAERISCRLGNIRRFDIVIYNYRYRDESCYIKRVIGLPRETVQITDGVIFVDGRILEHPAGMEPVLDGRRAQEPVILGENEYFLLGDNWNDSSDSRDYDIGNALADEIDGRVILRLWPADRLGLVR